MERLQIGRYPSELVAVSGLHKLDDALDLLSFLKADDFVSSELVKNHSRSAASAKRDAKRIASHASLASLYAGLCLTSPPEISFLPGYYCILNLAKCVSLSGPYSNEFDHHSRWHGATYNARGRAAQSVLTDEVRVRGGGALAHFYKTLTCHAITSDKVMKLKDFYHIVPGIGSELSIVSGKRRSVWFPEFSAQDVAGQITVEAVVKTWTEKGAEKKYEGNVRRLPLLKGFRKKPNTKGVFVKIFPSISGLTLIDQVRSNVATEFLSVYGDDYACSEQAESFPMPEEFASALAFFHLSSVCRYNPEFMEKLAKSKAWPMLLAMRRHSLYNSIISAWSYIIQKDYRIQDS